MATQATAAAKSDAAPLGDIGGAWYRCLESAGSGRPSREFPKLQEPCLGWRPASCASRCRDGILPSKR